MIKNLIFLLLLVVITPVITNRLQRYSYNYEGFLIFTDIGHDNNVMYFDIGEGVDILLLDNVTDHSVYRIEIYKEDSCILVHIHNDTGIGKMSEYDRKICDIGQILKVNWDRTKVTIHHDSTTLFHFSNEIQFSRVQHLSIRPKTFAQINYKNTYTFIANIVNSCETGKEPVVVCNFETVGKNETSRAFMRADFYKSKSDDNYEVKANTSFFTISKNIERKLSSTSEPFFNRKINFVVDLKRHHTSIHNPGEIVPLILWNEEDATYLESFNYVIIQNLKVRESTYSEINNSNNCEIKCFEETRDSFWSKIKTFSKGGFKVDNYCKNTDYLRD